jgi:large subunit ribosomal protein L28e
MAGMIAHGKKKVLIFLALDRTYKAIANQIAKNGYRADLRQAAVARASALRRSQRAPKPEPEKKLRGPAAKRAAAEKQ